MFVAQAVKYTSQPYLPRAFLSSCIAGEGKSPCEAHALTHWHSLDGRYLKTFNLALFRQRLSVDMGLPVADTGLC